jgi:hypothetical protein
MSTDNTRIFQCFKAGTHTAMSGHQVRFTEADLLGIAANYQHRLPGETAPLVLGHPATDAPAYGQVKELFVKQGVLYAVSEASDRLIKMVREKSYNTVSAAFKRANQSGGWALRHIGFLGAVQPALKDLEPIKFSECDASTGLIAFAGQNGSFGANVPPYKAPRGWDVCDERMALYNRARQIHADCPSLSFAEAAMLAEKFII